MHTLLETPRLIFRKLQEEDASSMYELDSNAEVHRYLGNTPVQSKEESEKIIQFIRKQYVDNGVGHWALIEKTSGEFIGWAGLKLVKEEINGHKDFYDLGYRLIPRYWGKGYATEAGKALVTYAFEILKTKNVFAFVDAENVASIKVLQKAGLQCASQFEYEGQKHLWFHVYL